MPAGRPRTNDDLYEEIRSRIQGGETRKAVVEDVANRTSKSARSLNSQYSVWINSRLPKVATPSNMRLVPLTAVIDVQKHLESILIDAEQQLAEVERWLSELEGNRQSLTTHIAGIQAALDVTRSTS